MDEASPQAARASLYLALREFIGILEELKIEYYVVGSVAGAAWGLGRTPLAVDFMATLDETSIDRLIKRLVPAYYADLDAALAAFRVNRGFNVIEQRTFYKFDLFPLTDSPFHQSEFARRVWTDCPMSDGSSFPLAVSSVEDTILSKLSWYRQGGEVSNLQWNDLQSVVAVTGPFLDRAYLAQWAARLGVADLLDRLLAPPIR